MIEQDRARFLRAMLTLAETFGESISDQRIEAYFRVLGTYEIDEVEAMIGRAMRFCRYFPKPVELVEQLEGSEEDRAALAWLTFEDAMRRVGQYRSVEFPTDPAIAHAIQMMWGTWPDAVSAWIGASEPEWQGQRKEFFAVYRSLRRSPKGSVILAGLHEFENRQTGHEALAELQRTECVMIGRDQLPTVEPKALEPYGFER